MCITQRSIKKEQFCGHSGYVSVFLAIWWKYSEEKFVVSTKDLCIYWYSTYLRLWWIFYLGQNLVSRWICASIYIWQLRYLITSGLWTIDSWPDFCQFPNLSQDNWYCIHIHEKCHVDNSQERSLVPNNNLLNERPLENGLLSWWLAIAGGQLDTRCVTKLVLLSTGSMFPTVFSSNCHGTQTVE